MFAALSVGLSKIHEDPKAFAGVISVVLMATAFLAVLAGWLFLSTTRLELPLIIMGVTTIAVLVLLTEKTAALIMAILIIGTIVTKEEFLLKIGALVSGKADTVEASFYGQSPTPDIGTKDFSKLIAEAIQKELGTTATPEARRKIEKILTNVELDRIASRVRREGARTPLRRMVNGGERWRDFVERYEDREVFKEDMDLLRVEGLAICLGDDLITCKATETGVSVNELIVTPKRIPQALQSGADKSGTEEVNDDVVEPTRPDQPSEPAPK